MEERARGGSGLGGGGELARGEEFSQLARSLWIALWLGYDGESDCLG